MDEGAKDITGIDLNFEKESMKDGLIAMDLDALTGSHERR